MPTPLDVHGRRHASGQNVLGRQDPVLFVVVGHAVNLLHACVVVQTNDEEKKSNDFKQKTPETENKTQQG